MKKEYDFTKARRNPYAKRLKKQVRRRKPKPGSRKKLAHRRLEDHPEFLRRVAEARAAVRAGLGTRLEDVPR